MKISRHTTGRRQTVTELTVVVDRVTNAEESHDGEEKRATRWRQYM